MKLSEYKQKFNLLSPLLRRRPPPRAKHLLCQTLAVWQTTVWAGSGR